MEFTVGQKIWFTQPLHYSGRGLIDGEVTKTGRKYVYAKGLGLSRELKFNKETLLEDADTNFRGKLYTTKTDYEIKVEKTRLIEEISEVVRHDIQHLTIVQLREVSRILKG